MKHLLLFLPAIALTACVGGPPQSGVVTENQPVTYGDSWGTNVPTDSLQNIRSPEQVRTLFVNNYKDPNNPKIRHRGHLVDEVRETPRWNLRNTDTSFANLGPVTSVADPSLAPNPYSAEFETDLVEQRNQTARVAQMAEKMVGKMEKIDAAAQNAISPVEASALLTQIEEMRKEIRELKQVKQEEAKPKAGSNWIDAIKGMFNKKPPVATSLNRPFFRSTVAIREEEIPFPAPGIISAEQVASLFVPKEFYRMAPTEEPQIYAHQKLTTLDVFEGFPP